MRQKYCNSQCNGWQPNDPFVSKRFSAPRNTARVWGPMGKSVLQCRQWGFLSGWGGEAHPHSPPGEAGHAHAPLVETQMVYQSQSQPLLLVGTPLHSGSGWVLVFLSLGKTQNQDNFCKNGNLELFSKETHSIIRALKVASWTPSSPWTPVAWVPLWYLLPGAGAIWLLGFFLLPGWEVLSLTRFPFHTAHTQSCGSHSVVQGLFVEGTELD